MQLNYNQNINFELPVETVTGPAGEQPVRDSPASDEVNSSQIGAGWPSLFLFTFEDYMPKKNSTKYMERTNRILVQLIGG
jgi:hypothetical protein